MIFFSFFWFYHIDTQWYSSIWFEWKLPIFIFNTIPHITEKCQAGILLHDDALSWTFSWTPSRYWILGRNPDSEGKETHHRSGWRRRSGLLGASLEGGCDHRCHWFDVSFYYFSSFLFNNTFSFFFSSFCLYFQVKHGGFWGKSRACLVHVREKKETSWKNCNWKKSFFSSTSGHYWNMEITQWWWGFHWWNQETRCSSSLFPHVVSFFLLFSLQHTHTHTHTHTHFSLFLTQFI